MTYSLFPNDDIPAPPSLKDATIQTVSVWALAVLPMDDPRRQTIAGIYHDWLERGCATDRQAEVIRKTFYQLRSEYEYGSLVEASQ